MVEIEVAYANSTEQFLKTVSVAEGSTVKQALEASGVLQQFAELQLSELKPGIFAKPCQLDRVLQAGDRVEIYRALSQNPMDARRNRAAK